MADSNVERIEVPSAEMEFDFGQGVKLTADAIELDHELRQLAESATKDGKTHYEYLGMICSFAKERYGADLKRGQADALTIKIAEALTRKKKRLLADLQTTAGSPVSTDSTPSD